MGLNALKRAATAGAVAAVAALCLGGSAGSNAATAFDGARLSVDSLSFGGQSLLDVDLEMQSGISSDEAPGLAGRIDLTLPPGYRLDVSGAPGSSVGSVLGALIGADGSGFTFADGTITVDDPARWAADPVAQACAPGAHAALWVASPKVLGLNVPVPIAVDTLTGTGDPTYVLRICPTQPPSTAFPRGTTLESMSLTFGSVATPPASPGVYRWSALVTPASPGSFALQPASAFELRAVERRPATLTMRARFQPKTNTIAITGKLVGAGAPWGGATVQLFALQAGSQFPAPLGGIPTRADGSFSLGIPAVAPVTISASVSTDGHACSSPTSTAPGGCVSETDAKPLDAEATVIVPRATDPRLVVRASDQARAAASVLRAADLPGGTDAGAGPLPCVAFTPSLHRLTATGEASSDVFVSAAGHTAAFASALVFRTSAEAKADFAGVAKLAALRCEVKELTAGSPDEHVLAVGPLRIPRVGDGAAAFRAQVSDPLAGRVTFDDLFVRKGRVVIALHTYTGGSANVALDLQMARTLATRAGR